MRVRLLRSLFWFSHRQRFHDQRRASLKISVDNQSLTSCGAITSCFIVRKRARHIPARNLLRRTSLQAGKFLTRLHEWPKTCYYRRSKERLLGRKNARNCASDVAFCDATKKRAACAPASAATLVFLLAQKKGGARKAHSGDTQRASNQPSASVRTKAVERPGSVEQGAETRAHWPRRAGALSLFL